MTEDEQITATRSLLQALHQRERGEDIEDTFKEWMHAFIREKPRSGPELLALLTCAVLASIECAEGAAEHVCRALAAAVCKLCPNLKAEELHTQMQAEALRALAEMPDRLQ